MCACKNCWEDVEEGIEGEKTELKNTRAPHGNRQKARGGCLGRLPEVLTYAPAAPVDRRRRRRPPLHFSPTPAACVFRSADRKRIERGLLRAGKEEFEDSSLLVCRSVEVTSLLSSAAFVVATESSSRSLHLHFPRFEYERERSGKMETLFVGEFLTMGFLSLSLDESVLAGRLLIFGSQVLGSHAYSRSSLDRDDFFFLFFFS